MLAVISNPFPALHSPHRTDMNLQRSTFDHLRHLLLTALAVSSLLGAWLFPRLAWAQPSSSPQVLSTGVPVASLSGSQGSLRYFSFAVPTGATQAKFVITGTGDADVYVRYGSLPTTSSWDYRPYRADSNETVTVSYPRSGTWYVMLRGYTSYSNVTLTATHNATGASTAAMPTFSPAPGTYSGQVAVSLASATSGAVIRFTLDGSTPTSGSEVFVAPIQVTATTRIRAVAFASGMSNSTVADGTFTIQNTIRDLSNNVAITGLSGAQNSVANFRFAVPSGTTRVTFTLTGSSGNADLYVKYGQLATTSTWDRRSVATGSNETIAIDTPAAGDYFVMVHGYGAYSGVGAKAVATGTPPTGNKPDLIAWADSLNPYISTVTFASNSCDVAEGTITAGTKKLLRFSTQTRNIGSADLVLGNPANNPRFEWGACHGHYHFRSFAEYRLLDTQGAVVRTGRKVGFCLMDITRFDSSANPSARYSCSNQGIQAGWADIYSANLSGQWIDITGLPSGSYILEITMDPMNQIDELDETNNVTRANVSIQ